MAAVRHQSTTTKTEAKQKKTKIGKVRYSKYVELLEGMLAVYVHMYIYEIRIIIKKYLGGEAHKEVRFYKTGGSTD